MAFKHSDRPRKMPMDIEGRLDYQRSHMKTLQKKHRIISDIAKKTKLIENLKLLNGGFSLDDDDYKKIMVTLERINIYLNRDLSLQDPAFISPYDLFQVVIDKLEAVNDDFFEGERRGMLNSMTRLNQRLDVLFTAPVKTSEEIEP